MLLKLAGVDIFFFTLPQNRTMSYKVIDIEGIGANYASKLEAIGIFTTDDLLAAGGKKSERVKIAESTGIPESLILTWVNHSDLHRIKGIAGQISELMEAAGVDTVKELAMRNAENLHAKLIEVNEKFGLSGRVPSAETLQDMIAQAKILEPKVFH
jgi:predicted flap endonuclease-1-like 5' DNA nuclease